MEKNEKQTTIPDYLIDAEEFEEKEICMKSFKENLNTVQNDFARFGY